MKLKFYSSDLFVGSDIDKKVLNRIGLIFFGIFAIGILTLFYVENKAGDCNSRKQKFYKFEYNGKIIRTYRSNNHGHRMTVFENGIVKGLIFDYKVWEKLKPGDILIKHKNELNFTLISGKDTTNYREEISDCEQFKK